MTSRLFFEEKERKMNNKEQLRQAFDCMNEMDNEAKVWNAVKVITAFLEAENITYGQWMEVVGIVDHYTHHVAEVEAQSEDEDFTIDIDDEDMWFPIHSIG